MCEREREEEEEEAKSPQKLHALEVYPENGDVSPARASCALSAAESARARERQGVG